MAYTDDQMGPRRRALVEGLAGNTGISGAMPGGAGVPPIARGGGDKIPALSMYETTPEQNAEIQRRQTALVGQHNAAFGRDSAFLQAHNGQAPAGWRSEGSQLPDAVNPLDVLGAGAKNLAAPSPTVAAQEASAMGAKPDVYAPIAGFDFDKLSGKKAYDSAEKYSDAVRTFSKGLGSGVQVSRNNLGGMIEYAKANGFGNAKAVGDDKIDFGDGKGPIDVVRGNGELWFQNGPDRLGPAPAAAGGVKPMFAGSTVAPMLQGDAQSNIQQAMQQMGSLSDPSRLQQLIAALQGGGQ